MTFQSLQALCSGQSKYLSSIEEDGEKILESLYVSVVARHSLKTNRMHKKYVSKENLVAFFHIFVIMKYELYALKYGWKPLQISFCTGICELYYDLLWFPFTRILCIFESLNFLGSLFLKIYLYFFHWILFVVGVIVWGIITVCLALSFDKKKLL